jgi:hypothetical protein
MNVSLRIPTIRWAEKKTIGSPIITTLVGQRPCPVTTLACCYPHGAAPLIILKRILDAIPGYRPEGLQRATFAQLQELRRLSYGKKFAPELDQVVSLTLFHELCECIFGH